MEGSNHQNTGVCTPLAFKGDAYLILVILVWQFQNLFFDFTVERAYEYELGIAV